MIQQKDLIQLSDVLYEVPSTYREDMLVPARVFMNELMIKDVLHDRALEQLVNVATLPGIQKAAFAMPDIHQGYGFPIGGVAALAIDEGGVISPGGIGYDINCGIRFMVSGITRQKIKRRIDALATALFEAVPSGVGKGGALRLDAQELDLVLKHGARHMLKLGYGVQDDLTFCEEEGCIESADPSLISPEAKQRGADQLGTLGSGNHFLEVQYVDEIYDPVIAAAYGLEKDMVTMMIHCGSRGLGHQTCTDYVRIMMNKLPEWGYALPDRELIYAPFVSKEGTDYYHAMAAAANYAWANRHLISHWARKVWQEQLGEHESLTLVYDVSHNLGKVESHTVDGAIKNLIVHRKGATRAFGPASPEIPQTYQAVGQPVLIPGTMGTSSYILAGTKESMDIAFGSSCHGAGRRLSRAQSKKRVDGRQLKKELEHRGIVIRSDSDRGLAEEAPLAYKDVDNVVRIIDHARLAKRVVRVKPLAVIKGG